MCCCDQSSSPGTLPCEAAETTCVWLGLPTLRPGIPVSPHDQTETNTWGTYTNKHLIGGIWDSRQGLITGQDAAKLPWCYKRLMGTVHCPSSWRAWWCTSSTCLPDNMLLCASDKCLIFKAALIYSMHHAFACHAAQKAVHSHRLHPLLNKSAETPLMALQHFSCPMVQSAFAHQPAVRSAAI